MAGSTCTVSTSWQDVDHIMRKSVEVTLEYLSDDSDGSVPDQELAGLHDYVLIEVKIIPDDTDYPANNYEIILVDTNDLEIFASGDITGGVATVSMVGGSEGHPAGYYPRLDNTPTIKFVTHADHSVAADLDDEKVVTIVLRCEKK